MNIAVCGYWYFILEFSEDTFYIIPIVVTILIIYVMNADDDETKPIVTGLASLFFGFIANIIIASILYAASMVNIEDYQYKEFNQIMETINSNPTYLTKEQNTELNNWAKCSISNGTINLHEYTYLKSNFEKYSRENEIKRLTKEIENKMK